MRLGKSHTCFYAANVKKGKKKKREREEKTGGRFRPHVCLEIPPNDDDQATSSETSRHYVEFFGTFLCFCFTRICRRFFKDVVSVAKRKLEEMPREFNCILNISY